MLFFAYRVLVYLLLPIMLVAQCFKGARNPQYRKHLNERLGFGSNPKAAYDVWIHAVSVGEARAVVPLVKKLAETKSVLLTVTTPTGRKTAQSLLSEYAHIRYLPFDAGFCIRRFLKTASPKQAVVAETEVWPNLIKNTKKLGIPLSYINVRLSERSFQKYLKLKSFSQSVFNEIDVIAAQGKSDADRLKALGVNADKIVITGSLKFEMPLPEGLEKSAKAFSKTIEGERLVWICGSTREGEEELLLKPYKTLKTLYPSLLLMIVPRHPERFDEVAKLCQEQDLSIVRRTESAKKIGSDVDVYIGDTLGDLSLLYAASDIAFVGGSLVPFGGQNILEPCALGVPVLFGPHMFNFEQISQYVIESGAGKCVQDTSELQAAIQQLLNSKEQRQAMSEQGIALIEKHKGALNKVMSLLA